MPKFTSINNASPFLCPVPGVMEIPSLSGSFLSSFVITFILLLKTPTLASGHFSVIGPARHIQVPLGGEAELPCYLAPPQSAQHMEVVWLQSTRVVHLYQDGKDQFGDQAPNYRGRTELVRDAITNGNVTLKIRDVRLSDAGRYQCLFEDRLHQEEADMQLEVLGFYFDETSHGKEWKFGIAIGFLVITKLIPFILQTAYYFLKCCSSRTCPVPRADNKVTMRKFCQHCCIKLW
ncbi:myelin-oligodendrocyte glycoprotein-like isoform X3 [Notamacropus eugenii]|uniref:myelin-oligodendrocyte glycoprotein-like isoform X3 n=1 Tax=Notamacropus eugenii TaxID=9315 RepID=UPI003B670F29